MKKIALLLMMSASVLMLTYCTDDKLRTDLDTLSYRVENMEATVNSLNENMEAVQILLQQNKTIRSYTEEDGVYTLVLSDDTRITLTTGSAGQVVIPEISVSTDGYWIINGEKQDVKANGNTPQFRISNDGYWEVCTDGSGTYSDVLDESGNPVKATSDEGGGSGNTFFQNVEVLDGMLVVTLTGGDTYSLPIVEELIAEIVTSGTDFEGDTWFVTWGTTVTTRVKAKGENCFVTAPMGWGASLSTPDADGNAVLTVTAPMQTAGTRAVADNSSDLTLQVNKGVNWAVDKISVKGSVAADTPLEKFESGRSLRFGDLVINKEMFPDYEHLTADKKLTGSITGVFFVESGVTLTVDQSGLFGSETLIVVGNSGDREAKLVFEGSKDYTYANHNKTYSYFIFSNLNMDASSARALYMNNPKPSDFNFVFEDCDVVMGKEALVTLYNTNENHITSFSMKNCAVVPTVANGCIIGGEGISRHGKIQMENNVFYSGDENCITFKVINAKNAPIDEFLLKNNTFYNVVPPANDGYVIVNKITSSYTCTNNIFYHTGDMSAGNFVVLLPGDYESLDGSLEGTVARNVGYRDGGEKTWGDVWYNAKPVEDMENMKNLVGAQQTPFESVDVTNGVFIPKALYSDCGSSLR